MQRKWTVLAGTMAACIALTAGFSVADDEEGPLHKLMEKVQSNNNKIIKGVRTKVSYTKAQQEVSDCAKELVKLSKEAKGLDDAIKSVKGVDSAKEKWEGFSDEFTKEATKFAAYVADKGISNEDAKKAYKNVSKSCSACHAVFKSEE
jgi:cytochrome c556